MNYEIGTDGIDALVVGFDTTAAGRDALAFAAGMARRNHAHLTVVHVPPTTIATLATMTSMAGEAIAAEQEVVDSVVDDVATILHPYQVPADVVVCRGNTASVIEDVADARRADAIVVGRPSGRQRRESVPARLLELADRPVMVIP
jgi:nucleotide-binding universal stress UspA family protein